MNKFPFGIENFQLSYMSFKINLQIQINYENTFKEVCLVNNGASREIPNMGISVRFIRNTSPLIGNVQRVSVARSISMVFVHPIVVSSEKVGVEYELVVRSFSYPVKYCIKASFANTCEVNIIITTCGFGLKVSSGQVKFSLSKVALDCEYSICALDDVCQHTENTRCVESYVTRMREHFLTMRNIYIKLIRQNISPVTYINLQTYEGV